MSIAKTVYDAKTAGQKSAATKKLNKYVAEKVAEGKDETQVRAGVKASVTRLANAQKLSQMHSVILSFFLLWDE